MHKKIDGARHWYQSIKLWLECMNQLIKLEKELSNIALLIKILFEIQIKGEVTISGCVQACWVLTPITQQSVWHTHCLKLEGSDNKI